MHIHANARTKRAGSNDMNIGEEKIRSDGKRMNEQTKRKLDV